MSTVQHTSSPEQEALELIGTLAAAPEKTAVLQEFLTERLKALDTNLKDASVDQLRKVLNEFPSGEPDSPVAASTGAVEACSVKGVELDPRIQVVLDKSRSPIIQAVLDKYFTSVDASHSDRIGWELRDGAVAKDAVREIDALNRELHRETLLPTDYAASVAEGYETAAGARTGEVVLGVSGSQKNYWDMLSHLAKQNMSLSTRYDSIVSLNLSLLLRGEHPLEGGKKELRDARGVLAAYGTGLYAYDHVDSRSWARLRLSALGSPN